MNRCILVPRSVLTVVLFASACGSERNDTTSPNASGDLGELVERQEEAGAPYAFADPDVSMTLRGALREISGITAMPDGRLAAIQDEDGIVFLLNPETGAVELSEPFGRRADYEGIAWAGDRLFVLRSNGRLFEITGWPGGSLHVETIRTHLRGRNDAEGLAYDSVNRRLLVACKENPGYDLGREMKAVYGFDLDDRVLGEAPVYVLDTDELEQRTSIRSEFKPSAIAVHPATDEVYVLSATASSVVVLGPDGAVRGTWRLADSLFEQPEGLAFLPDGTLFISSEGSARPPMLHRFTWKGGD